MATDVGVGEGAARVSGGAGTRCRRAGAARPAVALAARMNAGRPSSPGRGRRPGRTGGRRRRTGRAGPPGPARLARVERAGAPGVAHVDEAVAVVVDAVRALRERADRRQVLPAGQRDVHATLPRLNGGG